MNQDEKSFKQLQAQFALRGHELHREYVEDDMEPTYWVTKWGQSRTFSNPEDVRTFLRQIGGNHAL